ncbi:MAG: sugar ABC transporter substrate-binding protein [Chloroflexota bacterium]
MNRGSSIITRSTSRRAFVGLGAAGAAVVGGIWRVTPAFGAEGPQLVTQIRSLSNPYHAVWAKGAENFAASAGLEAMNEVQTTEGDSQKGVAAIKAVLAKYGSNCVVNIDPNASPDAVPIVKAVQDAGAWIVTHWNKPPDLHPWDYSQWVAHIAYDGTVAGYEVSKQLFEAMGGKGNVVAIQGNLANPPAVERFAGMKEAAAEYPEITLLEDQIADWDQTKALNIMQTWLTKYGDEINGVWCANDGMGLGALEALRAAGKAGAVPVVGVDGTADACQAILAGEFAATMANDPFWQGGMGLSLGWHAWNGELVPSEEPNNRREFYAKAQLVTKDNAQEFLDTVAVGNVDYDWNDLWSKWEGGFPGTEDAAAAATPAS